jgi:hypothetical protein
MDYLTLQYLEYRPELAALSPEEVGGCLVDAASRLPLTHLLVGWDLPPALLEVCQRETRRMGIKLYRWHPLLTGDPESVHRAGVSVRGQTISESALEHPDDALDFEAPDLARDRSDD